MSDMSSSFSPNTSLTTCNTSLAHLNQPSPPLPSLIHFSQLTYNSPHISDHISDHSAATSPLPPHLSPLAPMWTSLEPLQSTDSLESLRVLSSMGPTPPPPQLDSCVTSTYRVYATCSQGGRKYMEDTYSVSYQTARDSPGKLSFIYLAIFDGHGGDMAANYARDHLCQNIIKQRSFWSMDDNRICQAISKGFVQTHHDMMKEVVKWPKTASGLPSTSGTTASIVFIMNGKYYTGHVGDSRIVLGRKNLDTGKWMPYSFTDDHKPASPREKKRIEAAGGQVMNKSGVDRVVWNRPKSGHRGPIRRSTSFDQIPFLAVARSLGDLWSFNPSLNTFIVSPEPDVKCIPIDPNDKCLLLASDGLWNMMMTHTSIKIMQKVEEEKYSAEMMLDDDNGFDSSHRRLSPSRALVHYCLNRWYQSSFRADNITVLSVMIDHGKEFGLNCVPRISPLSSSALHTTGGQFAGDEMMDEEDGDFQIAFYMSYENIFLILEKSGC